MGRNPRAAAAFTTVGTPASALEAYEADTAGTELDEVFANLEHDVHARIRPAHMGRQPSRDELELELGMP